MSTLFKLTDLPDNDPKQRHDFERRYVGTYMLVNGVPCYCRGVDGSTIIYLDIHGNAVTWDVKKDPEADVTVYLPKTGYYNVDGNVLYLYKHPQRQWRRSFCGGLYNSDLYPIRDGAQTRTIVREIYKNVYTSLDSVCHPLFARVAINKEFAVKTSDGVSRLYYRNYAIATLDFSDFRVKLTAPEMLQEVIDLFKYTGVTKWKI